MSVRSLVYGIAAAGMGFMTGRAEAIAGELLVLTGVVVATGSLALEMRRKLGTA